MKLSTTLIDFTPLDHSPVLLTPDAYLRDKPLLRQAMELYEQRYLPPELGTHGRDGIEGEGEKRVDVLNRLQGDDPNVPRMSVIGLLDETGRVQGISLVETYEVTPELLPGETPPARPGLVHLCTYAAVSDALANDSHATQLLHQRMMEELKNIDHDLGHVNNSVLKVEVNCKRGFNNESLHSTTGMDPDPEFEIKTGAHRRERGIYDLKDRQEPRQILIPGTAGMRALDFGRGALYAAPNLNAAGKVDLEAVLHDVRLRGEMMTNLDIIEGRGEPLYIASRSPYHEGPLTARELALGKAYQEALHFSVACGNVGIEDRALIREAFPFMRGFSEQQAGYDAMIKKQLAPDVVIDPRTANMEDLQRAVRPQQK